MAANAYAGRGLHGQTVEPIGTRIVRGELVPGSPLHAEALERQYGVSRTVVREALKVLAAKGLVESRPKRGTVVRPRAEWNLLDADVLRWLGGGEPDVTLLDDLAELRAIVEPAAARLAASRRTGEDLAALDAALEQMTAAGSGSDTDAVVAADVAFHRALLRSAHNELLTRMEVVLVGGLALRDRLVHHGRRAPDPVPAHRAVVEAVRDGNAERAGRAAESLLVRAGADLADARSGTR